MDKNIVDEVNEEIVDEDEYDEDEYDIWDDYDWCYECTGYGDDYYIDEHGELVSNCDNCMHNLINRDDDDDDDWDN